MKPSFTASIPAVAIASIFALACTAPRAAAQQPGITSAQCIATSVGAGGSGVVIYVSQIVPMQGGNPKSLNGPWGDYVKAVYKVENLASAICQPMSGDPAIQQRVLAAEQQAWQKNGMNVVQVNWQMGGPPHKPASDTNPYAAVDKPAGGGKGGDAPADAAPAPTGPLPRASYCYSDDKKPTIYFSDPFDTADLPSPAAWKAAFTKMLLQKYMYKGIVTCKDAGTIVDVQSLILKQKEALDGKQLVDTDWSYEPPAPAAQ